MVKKKKSLKPKTRSRVKIGAKNAKLKGAKRSRKTIKKAPVMKKKAFEVGLEKIGEVTHYFPHVKAAAVMVLRGGLKIGDRIYIKGHTTDFKEKINSIQLDRVPIQEAGKAQEIGLLVKSRVRIGDSVYRL